MRLGAASGKVADQAGFFRAENTSELEELVPVLDKYGLSAVASPYRTIDMDDDECIEFGERAAALGIVISEVHFLPNIMAAEPNVRSKNLADGRALLRKADLMGARCLLGFAGSANPLGYGAAAENYTDRYRGEVREMVLRVLDGIDLQRTKYGLEAGPTTFYYQPEGCAQLIAEVDHPDFGVHLDLANMVSPATYFTTTELIERTFDLLGDRIYSAHLKDITWDLWHQLLKLDECIVGDGTIDYHAYLRQLSAMDVDFACMCEHLDTEAQYATSFERLHAMAEEIGTTFVGRQPITAKV